MNTVQKLRLIQKEYLNHFLETKGDILFEDEEISFVNMKKIRVDGIDINGIHYTNYFRRCAETGEWYFVYYEEH